MVMKVLDDFFYHIFYVDCFSLFRYVYICPGQNVVLDVFVFIRVLTTSHKNC